MRKYITLKCDLCGTTFEGRADYKRKTNRCAKCVHIKNLLGEVFGRLTVLAISNVRIGKYQQMCWICLCECGNFTTVSTSNLLHKTAPVRSCGCLQRDIAKSYTGEKHPNWKGGYNNRTKRLTGTSDYREWRSKVYERDGYTCQCCGMKSNKLHPHHIIPKALESNLIFDVDNGITLCQQCHLHYHKITILKNVNKNTLRSFIEVRNAG